MSNSSVFLLNANEANNQSKEISNKKVKKLSPSVEYRTYIRNNGLPLTPLLKPIDPPLEDLDGFMLAPSASSCDVNEEDDKEFSSSELNITFDEGVPKESNNLIADEVCLPPETQEPLRFPIIESNLLSTKRPSPTLNIYSKLSRLNNSRINTRSSYSPLIPNRIIANIKPLNGDSLNQKGAFFHRENLLYNNAYTETAKSQVVQSLPSMPNSVY